VNQIHGLKTSFLSVCTSVVGRGIVHAGWPLGDISAGPSRFRSYR
jgi:hypothetical protein